MNKARSSSPSVPAPSTDPGSMTEMGALLASLRERHRSLDERITELDARRALSPEEQVERTKLKKEKLATRDRIEQLARQS